MHICDEKFFIAETNLLRVAPGQRTEIQGGQRFLLLSWERAANQPIACTKDDFARRNLTQLVSYFLVYLRPNRNEANQTIFSNRSSLGPGELSPTFVTGGDFTNA